MIKYKGLQNICSFFTIHSSRNKFVFFTNQGGVVCTLDMLDLSFQGLPHNFGTATYSKLWSWYWILLPSYQTWSSRFWQEVSSCIFNDVVSHHHHIILSFGWKLDHQISLGTAATKYRPILWSWYWRFLPSYQSRSSRFLTGGFFMHF
jgi:hypothetical protein